MALWRLSLGMWLLAKCLERDEAYLKRIKVFDDLGTALAMLDRAVQAAKKRGDVP